MANKNELPYSAVVAQTVYDCLAKGMSLNATLDKIRNLKNAPKSNNSLYRNYSDQVAKGRAAYQEFILDKANDRMKDGSDKILELALRSKVGWNPSIKIEEQDPDKPDENLDPISRLSQLLGRDEE